MGLTPHTFSTLDGVMQAPGAPDEDRDGWFAYGGWTLARADEAFGSVIAGRFAEARGSSSAGGPTRSSPGRGPRSTPPSRESASRRR